MEEKKYYYFAYGGNTNKDHINNSYPDIKFYSIGILYDYKLIFRKSLDSLNIENAYCDIEKDVNKETYGVIYELSLEDIKRLDIQEYNGILYKRKSLEIKSLNNNEMIKCYTYIMINKDLPHLKPADRYYKIVLDGYKFYKLPLSQLYNALYDI